MAAIRENRLRELPVEEDETLFAQVQFTEPEPRKEAPTVAESYGETAAITANAATELADEPAADRVQVITRGRELIEQEQFENTNAAAEWTLQQFSTNPSGEPWFALQQQNEDGNFRTLTGTREELDAIVQGHHLTVTELPPITEGEYFRRAVGEVGLDPEIVQERQEESFELSV